MIVLSGPSASGKTEVAKKLMALYGITRFITTTTRDMRPGEINGIDYFFVSKEKFEEMIKDDEFIEYTLYNGNMYGSTKAQIGENKVIAIEPTGLKRYIALNDPSIITFFLEVDEETRYNRMIARGDNEEDAKRRIEEDQKRFCKENLPNIDFRVDTKNYNVDQVTEYIFNHYNKLLKERNN